MHYTTYPHRISTSEIKNAFWWDSNLRVTCGCCAAELCSLCRLNPFLNTGPSFESRLFLDLKSILGCVVGIMEPKYGIRSVITGS